MGSRRNDGDDDPCHCAALRRAARRVSLHYDRHLTTSGLTTGQYSILAEIRRRGAAAPAMSELARALVMDRTALTRALQPLVRDGLVAIEASPSDRRARLVRVTAEGEVQFATARAAWATAQERFTRSFGREQAVALRTLLRLVGDSGLDETR